MSASLFSHGYGDPLAICIPGREGPLLLPKRLEEGLAPRDWFFPGSGVGAEVAGRGESWLLAGCC